MTKTYIAGKVTGLPPSEVTLKFYNMQVMLRMLGFLPVNPIEVVNNPEADWKEAMKICINALMQCDAVYALVCASNSKGAKAELELAKALGIPVFDNIQDLTQWNNSRHTEHKEKPLD